ncbi:MAG: radical SAM protein [Bryobacterales bacterium]|nr:radical SAM protein [Bryobacterales bacterium]
MSPAPATATTLDQAYLDNLRLSQIEYEQQQVYLYSRPRCLGIVLGNACNIDCIHCYQSKNGDNLLRPADIAQELRRELAALYPFLSTLRIQGGEVFAIRGFRDLVDDVTRLVKRPILSISTNGTLINDEWAERMVRTPFSNVTVSIDGGTRTTYNRLRRGADLDHVLANIDRVQRWKQKLGSLMPYLDSFFVVMRSNFREIPAYLELMERHGMTDVALQTMELSPENTAREPSLEASEFIRDRREVEELHALMRETLPRFQTSFRLIRVSGLQSLFEAHGLDAAFLQEGEKSLYPDSEGLAEGAFQLCPNPWTTLFLTENGNAHLCFISQPIGNLYSEPVAALWNCPRAVAKRAQMAAGNYVRSGCSQQYCGWRDGKPAPRLTPDQAVTGQRELVQLADQHRQGLESAGALSLVRRLLAEERKRLEGLELYKQQMETLLEAGQQHIHHLERKVGELEVLLANGQRHIDHLEAKSEKAIGDYLDLERTLLGYRESWLVRGAHRASKLVRAITQRDTRTGAL